jgi:hypothetical protein
MIYYFIHNKIICNFLYLKVLFLKILLIKDGTILALVI